MESGRRNHTGLVAALTLGLIVRVVWLMAVDTQPVTDFDWYFQRAASLANGTGYAVDGQTTAYWPVGYPAVLAIVFKVFGASVLAGKVLNTLLTLACAALAWKVALRLFADRLVADLTAFVVVLHPAFIAYSGILASEPLYTALTLCGVAACLVTQRPGRAGTVGAGIAFGLATLVRPQAFLVPAIACLCSQFRDSVDTYRGKTARAILVVYLTIALVLAPWTVRNMKVFGAPVFVSTNGGDNLLIGNSPRSNGLYQNPDTLGYDFSALGEVDRDRFETRVALEYIGAHPGEVVQLWPTKLWGTFLSSTDSAYWAFQREKGHMRDPGTGSDKPLFKAFREVCAWWVPTLLALAGAGVLMGWRWSRLPATPTAMIGYTAVLTLVFFGNPRFGFVAVPFLAMHACHGAVVLARRLRNHEAPDTEPDAHSPSTQTVTPESQSS